MKTTTVFGDSILRKNSPMLWCTIVLPVAIILLGLLRGDRRTTGFARPTESGTNIRASPSSKRVEACSRF